jgi:GTP-binding protein
MKIKSVEFIKGLRGEDDILEDGLPQVAFIGRSNVGKSSVINSIVNRRDLARSSAKPGKTVEINFYKLNNEFYLVDLPGYGYAKTSLEERDNLRKLIYWYLLYAHVDQKKIVLIIDAKVGATDLDLEILRRLSEAEKNIIIIANKFDKLKNSEQKRRMNEIRAQVGEYPVIPYSALEKTGLGELINTIFGQ